MTKEVKLPLNSKLHDIKPHIEERESTRNIQKQYKFKLWLYIRDSRLNHWSLMTLNSQQIAYGNQILIIEH